jgi:hypothetical protein
MKLNRFDIPYSQYVTWSRVWSEGRFYTVSPDVFEGILPSRFLSKTNSALVMISGSPQATAFIANFNRVDMPNDEIDQHPYILVFDHAASAASGGFVDHGGWLNRTTMPDNSFFDAIAASGIQAYYPLQQMPTSPSGLLEDLDIDSQKEAFWASLRALGIADE